MRITQRRIGDRIAFFNDSDYEVGTLFDGRDQIVYDQPAMDFSAAIMGGPPVDLQAEFAKIGLDVVTARLIDSMPSPDASL